MVEVPKEMQERLKKQKIDLLTERYFMAQMDKAAYEAIGDTERASLEVRKMEEYAKSIAAIKEL